MFSIVKNAATKADWTSPRIQTLARRFGLIYDSRWSIVIILAFSTLIGLLTVYAYAPAGGADVGDYFLQAAYLAGHPIPAELATQVPLVPIVIALLTLGLSQIYLLVGLQVVMGIVLPVFFYVGIRKFNPLLAFVAALVIAGDTQVRVVFNLVATEPYYIFLIALAFCLLLLQITKKDARWFNKGDVALAVTLALLIYTRTVGRFIILPFLLVFALTTRQWKRSAVLLITHVLASVIFGSVYHLAFPKTGAAVGSSNDVQIMVPLFRSGLLNAADGPASAEVVALYTPCKENELLIPVQCMIDAIGSRTEALQVFNQAVREMVTHHPVDYGLLVMKEITGFLRLSGQQFRDTSLAQTQCANLETSAEQGTRYYWQGDWVTTQTGDVTADALHSELLKIFSLMCPPLPESAAARQIVDFIALRYRSISRPDVWIWYSLLAFGLLVIRWSRRLIPLTAAAFLILMYHAAISSVIFNVQPRYVVVMNPFKAVLLVTIIYLLGRFALGVIDEAVARKATKTASN